MNKDQIQNARHIFDFKLIPSLVLSDDVEDFVLGVINSKGEVLAEILNDTFEKVAQESGAKLQTDRVFSKEDFGVVNGKVDDERIMLIIEMPENDGGGLYCCYYAVVYNVTDRSARLFAIAKNESVPQATPVIFEFSKNETVKNYGPIEPGMRNLMQRVLDISGKK